MTGKRGEANGDSALNRLADELEVLGERVRSTDMSEASRSATRRRAVEYMVDSRQHPVYAPRRWVYATVLAACLVAGVVVRTVRHGADEGMSSVVMPDIETRIELARDRVDRKMGSLVRPRDAERRIGRIESESIRLRRELSLRISELRRELDDVVEPRGKGSV